MRYSAPTTVHQLLDLEKEKALFLGAGTGTGTGRDGDGDGTAMEKSHPSEAETTSAVTVAQPPSGQVCDQLGKLVQAKAVMPDQVDQLPRLHEQPASVWRP